MLPSLNHGRGVSKRGSDRHVRSLIHNIVSTTDKQNKEGFREVKAVNIIDDYCAVCTKYLLCEHCVKAVTF